MRRNFEAGKETKVRKMWGERGKEGPIPVQVGQRGKEGEDEGRRRREGGEEGSRVAGGPTDSPIPEGFGIPDLMDLVDRLEVRDIFKSSMLRSLHAFEL